MFLLCYPEFVKIFILSAFFFISSFSLAHAQVGAMNFYKISKSGNDKLNINNREYALLSIAYLEEKNNRLYEEFWNDEGFKSPRDMFVKLSESSLHEDGIVIIFDISPKVARRDTGFVKHKRFAHLLSRELNKKMTKVDSAFKWVKWMVGINENYRVQKRSVDSLNALLYKFAFRYVDPPGGDIALLDEPSGKAKGRRRISVREYAMIYLKPMLDDIKPKFIEFLEFNALQEFENAELKMEPSRYDSDVISIVFRIDNKTRVLDFGYNQLKQLTNELLPFVEKKIRPMKTDWLKIRFEVEPIESTRDRMILGETKLELPTDSTLITPETKQN